MSAKYARSTAALTAALLALALTPDSARADQAYISGGQLVAYGSSEDDYMLATEDLTHGTVTVAIYGLPSFQFQFQQTFPRSQVSRLYLNPIEGDDWAVNQTSLPSSMEGWSGNDVLWGGGAADDLWGDSSYYTWIAGDDYIDGGDGDDTLHGGPGDDTIFGDGGNNTAWPDGGKDSIDGSNGTLTVYLRDSLYPWISVGIYDQPSCTTTPQPNTSINIFVVEQIINIDICDIHDDSY